MLRCYACEKPLKRYAVSNVGADGVEYGWGPKCGRDVIVRRKRQVEAGWPWKVPTAKAPARDPHTRDWINETAQAVA